MFNSRNFDKFIASIDETEYSIDKDMKDRVLCKTIDRLDREHRIEGILPEKKSITPIFTLRNIAAAVLLVFIISAALPNNAVHALCQKIFSFIPGVGVVENEGGAVKIDGALSKPVKIMKQDEFLEVKSAYLSDSIFYVTLKTNIGVSQIKDLQDKEELLKYSSGETMPTIYLLADGRRFKLQNFSSSGSSLKTAAFTISGCFYIDRNIPDDGLFRISVDGLDGAAEFRLSPVRNGNTPEAMGSTIIVQNIRIFANTDRSDGILTLSLTAIAQKTYKGVRLALFDHEKAIFPEGISILDKEGVRYQPDEELGKQNGGGINTFYFRIADTKQPVKIVIPQILYSQDCDTVIKMNMPQAGKAVKIDKEIDLGDSALRIGEATLVPKGGNILPDDFKKSDCLKIGYTTSNKKESNTKILRMIPEVQVPDGSTGYMQPSSSVYSEICPLDKNEGYALTEFENMDKTKKLKLAFEVELAVMGPFEIKIQE